LSLAIWERAARLRIPNALREGHPPPLGSTARASCDRLRDKDVPLIEETDRHFQHGSFKEREFPDERSEIAAIRQFHVFSREAVQCRTAMGL
jgi:hypothetical protein